MELVDMCAATSTGDGKHCVSEKTRNWHKRLQLRKTVVQPPAMQSEDKNGPNKIAEEWEQTTVLLSSKKPPQEAPSSQRMTNNSGNTLRFACSQCKDSLEYVPKDLVQHFVEKHRGSPPVFPCHTCTFSTHELSYLQVHLLSHKDTFSSCSMCNDNVQRTWPEFRAHLTMYHCRNGKYSCEMCQKFSTNDLNVFLEHIYEHNLNLEEADDVDQHKKDGNQTSTTPTLHCQHCGFEASEKWLISKHVKADHVCQIGNQGKEKRQVNSLAVKPADAVPRKKTRITRSSVRDTCWLTQDCLSLPGREFLDKYCHLSDPQTTLEKTQQFLMQSVAGETDDQKWTKALKTVLSNVPQEMNLYQSENGIVSNTSDLAVLTVKNKITVAQKGAPYVKRLKMTTSTEKRTVCPESVAGDAQSARDHNECESDLKDQTPCPQVDSKLQEEVSRSVVNEPSPCTGMQENRENQEFKTDQNLKEHGKKLEGSLSSGTHISSDVKLKNEGEEKTLPHKVIQRRKKRRRQKRKPRFKNSERSEGQALKIVLKKNPDKEKQWLSQSSLSADDGGIDGHDESSDPRLTVEETVKVLGHVQPIAVQLENSTKGSPADPDDPPEARTPGERFSPCSSIKPPGPEDVTGLKPVALECFAAAHEGTPGSECRSADPLICTGPVSEVEMHQEAAPLPKPHDDADSHVTEETESPAAAVNPQPGEPNLKDFCLEVCAEQSDPIVEVLENRDVPPDSSPDLPSGDHPSKGKAIQRESSPASGHQWRPVPKHQERTLKLVAINPSQLVKRPAGDQPVVVLNHPDADIPQVVRIMEVVNRYREVQKVILSHSTLSALSALNSETNDSTSVGNEAAWQGQNSVQERFTLKLKFRRLSRKKYEIVGAVSPSQDFVLKFSCWFCGRVFTSQDAMMLHRQRHLMEWKNPKCENS